MEKAEYLPGAIPYARDIIRSYIEKGWWLNLTYGDLLDRSAANHPRKLAVIDERKKLTFQELKERVDRFAVRLVHLGVKKFDRMLIQLPNRHEFLIAFLAAHRIGAVPVLLIPRHEYREVSHFVKLTEPVAWVVPSTEDKKDFLPLMEKIRAEAIGLKYVITPEEQGSLPRGALSMSALIEEIGPGDYSDEFLKKLRPDPNDVAMILPTGGTTGLPKAVPRTHNSFLTNVRYTNEGSRPDDVAGLATPIGHTMAHQGAVGKCIMFGVTVVLIPVPRAKPILDAIQNHGITTLTLVPTQLEDILSEPQLEQYNLSSLHRLRTTGAALRPETVRKAEEMFGKIGTNFGGSSFGSTEGPCTKHFPGEPSEVFRTSIGMPMCEGDHWKVINDDERKLPANTEGELCAKGPCVFTGYYKSEAENRQIFTRDGYYKMGDLGKIDEQGHIFIMGRKKDIIQRGGEGVVPGEIESLLHMHPAIETAAVVGMPDVRLGERACAYVVLKPGQILAFDEMVTFLKGLGAGVLLLPERLEIVKRLPLTAAGKVDKKALLADISEKLGREGLKTSKFD